MDELNLKKPIFLCGMMGSGKSTVGRHLATELDVPFCDLDELIVNEAGKSIPDIFADDGEEAFRLLERKLLIKESQYFKGVMALGGGSLQSQHITDHLKIYGWLVFLDVPQSVLYERISGDKNRPMLRSGNSTVEEKEKIKTLLHSRRPFYEQAEITIKTGFLSPEDITHELIKKLTLYDGFNRR